MPRRVTLRDISKVTGFHFSTVGLALRGDPRLNPETTAKIISAAQSLGYRRDAMLSALSSYRHENSQQFHGVIGLLGPELIEPNAALIAAKQFAEKAADRLGFKIAHFNINEPGMTGKRMSQVLKTRGIEGLILCPQPTPSAYMNLDWDSFCAVALGYSITAPALHRACFHQARTMFLHLKALRSLGYKRIGILLNWNADIRTDHNLLGAYLAEQKQHPVSSQIRPYLNDQIEKTSVKAWLRREKPDCVLGIGGDEIEMIESLGYKVPDSLGFSSYCWSDRNPDISGVDERWGALGTTAVDLLFELMKNREYGVPQYPRFALIEGIWREGGTVRNVNKSTSNSLV